MADVDRRNDLAWAFARFAEDTYRGSSPLYEALAQGVSEDSALLDIASSAAVSPVPNLLFGAVHYLLIGGTDSPLKDYYTGLAAYPRPPGDAFPHFREFCVAHEDELRGLLATRRVQTNVVGRCSYLLPAFSLISGEASGNALSLVDVGASAGLSLLWDRYRYVYGGRIRAGVASSPVGIEAEVRGEREPPVSERLPAVAFRVGIDLHPVDLTDAGAALWLRALIWPEHLDRAEQMQAAIALARDEPPQLIKGDAVEVLLQAVERAPMGSALCIFNNSTLIYMPKEDRRKLVTIMEEISATRDVYWLSAEGRYGYGFIVLELTTFRDGVKSMRELAKVDHHGRWLEWMD